MHQSIISVMRIVVPLVNMSDTGFIVQILKILNLDFELNFELNRILPEEIALIATR